MKDQTPSPEQVAALRQLAIADHDFLAFVRQAAHLGYGRMLQIVQREYYRAAVEDELCPASGVLVVNNCLGQLSIRDQSDWIAGYHSDPLFRKRS